MEQAEYAECLLKARFFEAARRPLELIETLKFDGRLCPAGPPSGAHGRLGQGVWTGIRYAAAREARWTMRSGQSRGAAVRLTLDEQGLFAGDRRAAAGQSAALELCALA
jgi:hypothetical protein